MQAFIDESVVLQFYLEQMDQDNITFLQGKEHEKNEIRRLIFKMEEKEDIHQKIVIAKELWKLLFERSMSSILEDKRGYDAIFSYFDAYVDFEELIFASDSFYRDHTLHCLWVYFLGEYLYNQPKFKKIFKYIHTENSNLFDFKELFKDLDRFGNSFKVNRIIDDLIAVLKQSDATRCLMSLTHDLGYPLKKIRKVNASISKILPYFSIREYAEFNFNYSNEQLSSINSFYDFLSDDITISFGQGRPPEEIAKLIYKVDGKEAIDKDYLASLSDEQVKIVEDYLSPVVKATSDLSRKYRLQHDFENFEHGIMSAFILYKELLGIKNIALSIENRSNIDIEKFDYKKIFSIGQIFLGIANHTSSSFKIKTLGDPSSFLILIDELEEFSRISRANQNRQYISEFCKSAIYMEEDWFCVDFVFDNEDIPNLDPERAFKGRCKKMLSLFDIPNLDQDLKIRLSCIDRLFGEEKTYTIEVAHCHAQVTINGEDIDIPKYLKTREFYTSQEYKNFAIS